MKEADFQWEEFTQAIKHGRTSVRLTHIPTGEQVLRDDVRLTPRVREEMLKELADNLEKASRGFAWLFSGSSD